MRNNTMKYVGATLITGMVVGLVGTAMMGNNKGMRSARKSAKKAVNAAEHFMDNVRCILD